jgi:hypothetical protein
MAITTLDGALAGMQPPIFVYKTSLGQSSTHGTLWGALGIPSAGSYDTTLAGVALSSTSAQVAGQIPFTDQSGGFNYLNRMLCGFGSQMSLILVDRLWHNGGLTITSTSAQTVNSTTWPARDINGSTNGEGIFIAVEVSSSVGAATPSLSINYTNSAGTTNRTGTVTLGTNSSATTGSMYLFSLQSGDLGVRSIQSVTLSASWVSGTINLVAFRYIAQLDANAIGVPASLDIITGGFPKLYNGSVPYFIIFGTSSITAMINFTKG